MHVFSDAIEVAGKALAEAVRREMDFEDGKAVEQLAAIRRLIGSPNDLTGKPHSASSAKDIIETDPQYRDFLARRRQAVYDKLVARAHYAATLSRAGLAPQLLQEAA